MKGLRTSAVGLTYLGTNCNKLLKLKINEGGGQRGRGSLQFQYVEPCPGAGGNGGYYIVIK